MIAIPVIIVVVAALVAAAMSRRIVKPYHRRVQPCLGKTKDGTPTVTSLPDTESYPRRKR
jgi:hypothetical protein